MAAIGAAQLAPGRVGEGGIIDAVAGVAGGTGQDHGKLYGDRPGGVPGSVA
jgi:hypothetical protein